MRTQAPRPSASRRPRLPHAAAVRLTTVLLLATVAGTAGVLAEARRRWVREPDAGYTTEAFIITALLVALAVAGVAILTPKVLAVIRGMTF